VASVASAAIVSGELIIGLDDGSIIRAGYVQGPQGLKGDRGPTGFTGPAGQDGNGLLHGAGVPVFDDGKDGDFYIDTKAMKFYGPKVSGKWGSGVALLPKDRGGTLPTGMKTQGGVGGSRAFAAAMGGAGGGTVVTGGAGGSLQTILVHNKTLAAGAPVIDPATSTVTTPAVWTDLAVDPDGDAFIVDINAEGANGAMLVEVAVMRDQANRTGYSQVYEVKTGAPPILTFDAYNAPSGNLALRMYSSENLVNIRGRILYI
jgi:hypothetical protein